MNLTPHLHKIRLALRIGMILCLVILIVRHLRDWRASTSAPSSVKSIEIERRSAPGYQEYREAERLLETGTGPQGNTPEARAAASEILKRFLDSGQISRQHPPRIYCLLHEFSVIFLLDSERFRGQSGESQNKLALALWPIAQELAASRVIGYPTVGLALRDGKQCRTILIGGRSDAPILTQMGGAYTLYPYFEGEPNLASNEIERKAQTDRP